ncbi:MAG: 50S ribosomal protein L24 [Bacteroidia bacterium]
MATKLKIKKGDTVVVIAGEHRGEDRRKVLTVDPKSSRATLEGVTIKKHSKPTAKFPQGGIVDIPATIHVSNLMLVDGDGNATRVGRRLNDKTNKIERYSKKNNKALN